MESRPRRLGTRSLRMRVGRRRRRAVDDGRKADGRLARAGFRRSRTDLRRFRMRRLGLQRLGRRRLCLFGFFGLGPLVFLRRSRLLGRVGRLNLDRMRRGRR